MRAKVFTILMAAFLMATATFAQDPELYRSMSTSDATKSLTLYGGAQSRVSMWIWTDKYVYQPGQPITLRWTVKTNNDLYPYVVIAYRQNNQTGEKFYLPGGGETVADLNGNTLEQGFQPSQMTDANKAALVPTLTAPSELGMHTFVLQLRDYTGTRVLKTSYMKIGVVSSVQTLQGEITADRTLTNDTQWNLTGLVAVKNNATLTMTL